MAQEPQLPQYLKNLVASAHPAARLKALVEARAAANALFDAAIAEAVRATKEGGGSWREIAGVLGVDPSTVQRRYGHLVGQQLRGRRR